MKKEEPSAEKLQQTRTKHETHKENGEERRGKEKKIKHKGRK